MAYYADLHIHSRFSRATARNLDLPGIEAWAACKGIAVVGTGDFTHPGWMGEIREMLEPSSGGLFRLKRGMGPSPEQSAPSSCRGQVQFILSVEISTIYKKGGRTRKVHHVILAPDLECAGRITKKLSRIGNLHSDGRPILGLDSRDLMEIVLESGPGAMLIPAHIWTPWFSVLGWKSGFDSVDECYGDLSGHIHAVETGLSSDPAMNWMVPSLDRFRLISSSDAHSPAMLGREATAFQGECSYHHIRSALETGKGYLGTVEMFPQEGKYHMDGHRKCGLRLTPEQTREHEGRCPRCGGLITVGVMSRVSHLASGTDRKPPGTAGRVESLVPLAEVLSEILGVGPRSKRVTRTYHSLLTKLGPELGILTTVDLEEIRLHGSSLLAEAIERLRRGEVKREAGYDGEYGVIRLFTEDELSRRIVGDTLFELAPRRGRSGRREDRGGSAATDERPSPVLELNVQEPPSPATPLGGEVLSALDPDQKEAALLVEGPVLVSAGPGSGKTRTLTHRIAHMVRDHSIDPGQCLAITFTRRAAQEMTSRLRELLGEKMQGVTVATFHGLALSILGEFGGTDLARRVVAESEQVDLCRKCFDLDGPSARKLIRRISCARRSGVVPEDLGRRMDDLKQARREQGLVDFDDLIEDAIELISARPDAAASLRRRYRYVSVDEFQDVDEKQYQLLCLLVPYDGNLCVIGDADQSIYGFRGADARHFNVFAQEHHEARTVSLSRNYRCLSHIVESACHVLDCQDGRARRWQARPAGDAKIRIHQAPTQGAEAEWVVATIESLLGGHSFFSVDSGRAGDAPVEDVGFSDIAILYRTSELAAPLAEALGRSGMPYTRRSHGMLSELPAVRWLVSRIREDATRENRQTADLLDRLKQGRLVEEDEEAPDASAVAEAVDLLMPLAASCGDDLEGLVRQIELGAQVDTLDPRADRISLLTLHASKGLEFRVVFIVGCEQEILPLSWGGEKSRDPDEERRLLYVGMTRAMEALFLSHARKRFFRGRMREMAPSPFLEDLPSHLVLHETRAIPTPSVKEEDLQLDLF